MGVCLNCVSETSVNDANKSWGVRASDAVMVRKVCAPRASVSVSLTGLIGVSAQKRLR